MMTPEELSMEKTPLAESSREYTTFLLMPVGGDTGREDKSIAPRYSLFLAKDLPGAKSHCGNSSGHTEMKSSVCKREQD